ncbi:MAG: VTT domain-containing protein [Candidatus Thermoplasmatota archaeon]|nr:VTT domain-containing protein [Candidatus Thermoplasmatota archaeon]
MGLLPSRFWDAWDSYVQWSLDLGLPGLGILSFTEAIIQPIPPEALTLPMFIEAQGNPLAIFLIWIVATLTSVAGAVVGWWLGKVLGRSFAEQFIQQKHITRLDNLIERYGSAGMFIAAVSPIPYKVLAWVAGMGEMDKRQFVIAGLCGRGLRFGVQAVAIGLWGSQILKFLANPVIWIALTVIALMVFIPAIRWWDGLLDEEE